MRIALMTALAGLFVACSGGEGDEDNSLLPILDGGGQHGGRADAARPPVGDPDRDAAPPPMHEDGGTPPPADGGAPPADAVTFCVPEVVEGGGACVVLRTE